MSPTDPMSHLKSVIGERFDVHKIIQQLKQTLSTPSASPFLGGYSEDVEIALLLNLASKVERLRMTLPHCAYVSLSETETGIFWRG